MSKKEKKVKKIYIYNRHKFCVPVTQKEKMSDIQFIVDDFVKKKVTFCLAAFKDIKKNEKWEIWRYVEEKDSFRIMKDKSPTRPAILYVKGVKVKEYKLHGKVTMIKTLLNSPYLVETEKKNEKTNKKGTRNHAERGTGEGVQQKKTRKVKSKKD